MLTFIESTRNTCEYLGKAVDMVLYYYISDSKTVEPWGSLWNDICVADYKHYSFYSFALCSLPIPSERLELVYVKQYSDVN